MHGSIRRQEFTWLVGPLAAVVLLFLAAAGFAQWQAAGIEDESRDMQVNALPSVTELSAARSHVTRIETAAAEALIATPELRRQAADALERARAALHARIDAAAATPWYPGEHEIYDGAVVPAIADLDEQVGGLVSITRDGAPEAARVRATSAVMAASDAADRALASMLDVNHHGSYVATSRIIEKRRESMHIAIALDTAAFVAAALLGFVAVQVWRRLRAVEAERGRLAEARASELEVFGHRVAHDLLSPLTAISFTLGALEREHPDDEHAKRMIGRAKSALARSQGLVRGMFEFARSGARPAPGGRADLARVVHTAIEELAAADPQAPEVILERLDDCELACDEGVLGVILSNLLGNAAKYSKESPVQRIVVRAQRVGASRARVEVEDSGPGIPPGLERSIFEPYVRAPGATQPGLGLGLATVQRLVSAHGGEVGVRGKDPGTIFWFELPALHAEDATSAPAPAREEAAALH